MSSTATLVRGSAVATSSGMAMPATTKATEATTTTLAPPTTTTTKAPALVTPATSTTVMNPSTTFQTFADLGLSLDDALKNPFPRGYLIQMEPSDDDDMTVMSTTSSSHRDFPKLWPCLLFPNFDVLYAELLDYEAQKKTKVVAVGDDTTTTSDEDKEKDKKPNSICTFTLRELNKLAFDFVHIYHKPDDTNTNEGTTKPADKMPVALVLGKEMELALVTDVNALVPIGFGAAYMATELKTAKNEDFRDSFQALWDMMYPPQDRSKRRKKIRRGMDHFKKLRVADSNGGNNATAAPTSPVQRSTDISQLTTTAAADATTKTAPHPEQTAGVSSKTQDDSKMSMDVDVDESKLKDSAPAASAATMTTAAVPAAAAKRPTTAPLASTKPLGLDASGAQVLQEALKPGVNLPPQVSPDSEAAIRAAKLRPGTGNHAFMPSRTELEKQFAVPPSQHKNNAGNDKEDQQTNFCKSSAVEPKERTTADGTSREQEAEPKEPTAASFGKPAAQPKEPTEADGTSRKPAGEAKTTRDGATAEGFFWERAEEFAAPLQQTTEAGTTPQQNPTNEDDAIMEDAHNNNADTLVAEATPQGFVMNDEKANDAVDKPRATMDEPASMEVEDESVPMPGVATNNSSRRGSTEDDAQATLNPSQEPPKQAAGAKLTHEHMQDTPKPKRGNSMGRTGRPRTKTARNTSSLSPKPSSNNNRTPRSSAKKSHEIIKPIAFNDRRIPSFNDVKHLLKRMGFSFSVTQNLWCYPNSDPNRNEFAVLGEDYFDTEEAFRARLCSHGLGEEADTSIFDTATPDGADLELWVRLSVVSTRLIKLPESRDGRKIYNDLLLLGFKGYSYGYAFDKGRADGIWRDESGNLIYSLNYDELYKKLSQYGLPKECDFDEIGSFRRLQIELWLAFFKRPLLNPSPSAGRGRRRSASSRYARSERSNRSRGQTKPGSKIITQDSETPLPSSPTTCDKAALANCNENPPGGAYLVGLQKRDIAAEMDLAFEDGIKMNEVAEELELEKEIWLGGDDCHLRKNANEIKRLLHEMILSRAPGQKSDKSDVTSSEEPAALYVCGTSGIGKTTTINWCSEQVVDSNQHIWKKHGINPVVVNINCAKYGTAGTNLRNLIMEDIASQCSLPFTQGNAGKVVQSALESTRWNSRKHLVILVLDEIDQLVDAESEAENAKTQGEKLLENLSEWSQNSRLVLVGIGNSMNNTRYRRADRFVKFRKTITFQAYSAKDIEEILKSRLSNESLVNPCVISYIAGRTANDKGDIRKAIEIMTMAIREARNKKHLQGQAEEASKKAGLPAQKKEAYLVGMKDVVSLCNSDYAKLSSLVEALPSHPKVVVWTAAQWAMENKKSGNNFMLTRQTLLERYRDVYLEKSMGFFFSIDDANMCIERLESDGIATVNRLWFNYNYDNKEDEFTFNYAPEELRQAAKDALAKDDLHNF